MKKDKKNNGSDKRKMSRLERENAKLKAQNENLKADNSQLRSDLRKERKPFLFLEKTVCTIHIAIWIPPCPSIRNGSV